MMSGNHRMVSYEVSILRLDLNNNTKRNWSFPPVKNITMRVLDTR